MTTKISNLWSDITLNLFQNIDQQFVSSFREPGGPNSRLAAWDPYDKSMRYYKFLLYNIAHGKPKNFFDAYKKIKNVNIGQPIAINVRGCDINIDHLFAVEEVLFIGSHVKGEIKSIVEIGAGFGRTCQAFLSIEPGLDSYTIIDLPHVLNLSRLYLKNAIPEFYDKVNFIDCMADPIGIEDIDLVINIDSFQEMAPSTIDWYMQDIVSKSKAFYCKNPTGKYLPETVGLKNINHEQLKDVYSLGYRREVIDLFDESDLNNAAQKYLQAYLPPHSKDGGTWSLVADEAMQMFPYLHNALYCKS